MTRCVLVGVALGVALDAVSGFHMASCRQSQWVGGCVARVSRAPQQQRAGSSTAIAMEMDQNTIIGIAAGVGGLALGIGLVAFTEQQGVKTAERGIDEGMANKLQAKLLEDFELEENDVTSVTDRMRAALKQDKTEEELAELAAKQLAARSKEREDDGW
ncbi:hypothetical protein JKP88DRAFT_219548 [Tribonema minus]|uniref:Uncharacterized protein n=1 Tax=Tribonema minus TaxID=303371 RepID=A0A836CFV7_9STRA|nr:hypothetical protein JKP88DRAFT_219548 [Tribonema minus]